MTVFQLIFLVFSGVQAARAALRLYRGRRAFEFIHLAVWVLAIGLLLRPEVSSFVAQQVGIGRGADLLTYILCFVSLGVYYQFYVRYRSLQQYATLFSRFLAIDRAAVPPAVFPGLDGAARSPDRAAMGGKDGVYIVIPAFNEGERLRKVLAGLLGEYRNVVVVDDGSRDDTHHVACQFPVHALRHWINRGQGASLQTGITYSLYRGAEFIITFDADGQHQSTDLARMLEPVMRGECDVTLGSRFLGGDSNVPPARRLLLQAARLFTRLTSGLRLSDSHNGLRVFSRKAALTINLNQDRMAHASEIYDQIARANLTYREIPVTIRYTSETLAKGQKGAASLRIMFHYLFGKLTARTASRAG